MRSYSRSLLGTLAAFIKAKHRFAMFTGLSAAGIFTAYIIIPYKTPWLALSYVLPMCLIAGYGLGEFIQSTYRQFDFGDLRVAGCRRGILGIKPIKVIGSDTTTTRCRTSMPHAARVRGHDQSDQSLHGKERQGQGGIRIDVTSPDYWPMTWYVVNYKHVGYHGHIIDSTDDVIVTKKKDQDTEAIAKYSDKYKYVGMYPLRPGVDLNLLVRNELADPPCTATVQTACKWGRSRTL